ncbi:MAG TPA: type 1 glutamine amidotransferase [Geobacteraceae bacterium]|nr:type 1 glutamine amidotransferase [Geobacteraceae bacterium]
MKVHVLQHVPFEGIGSMTSWLSARDAGVTYSRFYESAFLPDPESLDLIIAMGGPMSVNDEASFPWLAKEKQFVRDAIQRGLPVIGICFGAQLIASALGARVYPNSEKEIGWLEIEAIPGTNNEYRFPEKISVFHWHGETFDLPVGATRLAKSAACANQAFQVGERVIGLQFHLETTPESLDLIINNCREELIEAAYVQTESSMRAASSSEYANINRLMEDILSFVMRQG